MNDRGRGARQPLQLAMMVALISIGLSQLVSGPVQSTPINTLQDQAQQAFAGLLILSAGFVLAGAVLPEPRSYWVEVAGQLGAAIALTVYTLTLKTTVPEWQTSMSAGYGSIAIGCYLRVAWLSLLVVANFYPVLFRRFARAYVEIRLRLAAARAAVGRQWRR
jgi:hypothetical protein